MCDGSRASRLGRLAWLVCAGAVLCGAAPQSSQVARARVLYNQRQYDAAIRVARDAASRPGTAAAASLVLARAHLERYRAGSAEADLTAARAALTTLDPSGLAEGDRVELLVGWGELFFLEQQHGIAVEMFEAALARADLKDSAARDRVIDWWAQSLDRLASGAPAADRQRVHERILARMEREIERSPDSGAVIYWLAASARGGGDLDRAWHAARAGWIRVSLVSNDAATLCADLDRLVTEAIIPERAQLVAAPAEPRKAAADMRAEWDQLKRSWPRVSAREAPTPVRAP
jgi:hypothetical protein